jgi:hypothetical protein
VKELKYTKKILKSSSPEPAGQNQSNLVQINPWVKGIKFVQIKGVVLFKEEITKM